MTPFDLPKVCIVTGATENVTFKPAKFQWYPRWIAVLAIAPLIMVIVMLVMMQKAEGQLPYSEAGWQQVKQKRMTAIAAVVLFLVCFFAGIALLDGATAFGAILMVVGVLALIAGVVVSRNGVPTVVKIDKQYIQLKLPSADAAAAIAQHLVGGAARRAQAQQQAMYQQQQYQQPPQG